MPRISLPGITGSYILSLLSKSVLPLMHLYEKKSRHLSTSSLSYASALLVFGINNGVFVSILYVITPECTISFSVYFLLFFSPKGIKPYGLIKPSFMFSIDYLTSCNRYAFICKMSSSS